ncbi:dihydrofolate reductase family protein [Microbacterium sp.]|uniref:dihydrofolate reductase family protein n=1 Tax=Microbacterium sp. TaxID=51671 RepID=UPI0028116CD6|nr:dihydrofolate reductase family protein [Microbacterium sp.]
MPIDRLWPDPASDLDDEALLAGTSIPEGRAWLRMNFIASIDGAATRDGLSGGLGDEADRRLFDLLRWPADAVLLGAGTARREGYAAMRLSDAASGWRMRHGLPPHPVLVLVSRSLDLDPASAMFTDAPVRPIICTVPAGNAEDKHRAERREHLAEVADLIETGADDADPLRIRAELAGRGLMHVHAEGGPHTFASFLGAGAVDALHLTVAPTLEAGAAGRIAVGEAVRTEMRLMSVLRADSELLLQYRRG